MPNFDFWYAAAPFFLIGLGLVAVFLGVHTLLRRVWPPIVKFHNEEFPGRPVELRREWEVRADRRVHVDPERLLRSRKARDDLEKLLGDDHGPKAA